MDSCYGQAIAVGVTFIAGGAIPVSWKGNGMKSRGFTLMEMAIVLATISILAAILTPVVLSYVDQARMVRATADVKTIADAIRLYQRDTARYPIYSSSTQATTDTPAATELVGPGTVPTPT